MTDPHLSWSRLRSRVVDALRALPEDRQLDLLLRDTCLTARWLPRGQVALELRREPAPASAGLQARGWVAAPDGSWRRRCGPDCRSGADVDADAAELAAEHALAVLSDLLAVRPDDVELWRPRCLPPPTPPLPRQRTLW